MYEDLIKKDIDELKEEIIKNIKDCEYDAYKYHISNSN